MISVKRIDQKEQIEKPEPLRYPEPSRPAYPAVILENHRVIESLDKGLYLLDNGSIARQAYSCALLPQVNDRVLIYREPEKRATINLAAVKHSQADRPQPDSYICQILEREDPSAACFSVPQCQQLDIQQRSIRLSAAQKLSLASARDLSLTAVRGSIQIKARQLVTSILGSIIETARERVSRTEFTQFQSRVLMHLQSKQAIFTADEDIKIDAERVNLG